MSARCAATATLSPTCFEMPAHRGSGIGEDTQHAVAGREIAIGMNRLQADMGRAGSEVRPQAAPDGIGVAP